MNPVRPSAPTLPEAAVLGGAVTREMLRDAAGREARGGSAVVRSVLAQSLPSRADLGRAYEAGLPGYTYLEGGRGSPFQITAQGLDALGNDVETIPSAGDERVAFWRDKLNGSASKIFDAFVQNYPMELDKDDIGHLTGLATRGGAFNTAMRDLKDHGLISGRGKYTLTSDLFE